ncbi:MAG: class I SAM-dependent methyltransferase [Candidatus Thermoplasmatota archaeon]|nr:class I SAM-dependent methyltransferase [Candidatus Thermoplasmatota archaeon]
MEKQKTTTKYLTSDYERINLKIINLFWYIVDRLSSISDFFAELYEKTVGNEYRKERDKFNLSKSKKILFIGCGPYPITALILAEMNGVRIVAIDHNEKCVKISRKVLEQKNINRKISVELGEGLNYPLKGFDTIIASGCSQPKIQVINHILQNSDRKSKIIIREAYYKDKIIKDIIKNFGDVELITKIKNHAFRTSNWESFYITKK